MAIYKLTYAEEHLDELFRQGHDGGEVFILRADGFCCQLLPMAAEIDQETSLDSQAMIELVPLGDLAPA